MCDRCEGADLSLDEVLDEARQLIARRRFAVQSVLGSQRTAEFSYTAGLTAHGLPELIVTGLRHDEASELLRCWGEYLLDDTVVLPGETLSGRHRIFQAVEVDRPEEHLLLARSLYGDRVRALQLAWADDRGRWPWESGHQARRAGQPLLGTPAPWFCAEHAPDRLDVPPHL